MTQPYGFDTFESFALTTQLCNTYVGPSKKSTTRYQLCITDPVMQKYALSRNFDTIGLR